MTSDQFDIVRENYILKHRKDQGLLIDVEIVLLLYCKCLGIYIIFS